MRAPADWGQRLAALPPDELADLLASYLSSRSWTEDHAGQDELAKDIWDFLTGGGFTPQYWTVPRVAAHHLGLAEKSA